MLKRGFWPVVALSCAVYSTASIAAEPTHLTCHIEQVTGAPNIVDITADEANGTVTTFVRSTGYRQKLPAVFRAEDVLFSNSTFTWRISRVDLSVTMTFKDINSERRGKCEVAKPIERAF